jgi:hypothetical protein
MYPAGFAGGDRRLFSGHGSVFCVLIIVIEVRVSHIDKERIFDVA